MKTQAKLDSAKDFAKQQVNKCQDIIESVRIHHGQEAAERITLLTNMLAHQQQLGTLIMSMLKQLIERADDDDIGGTLKTAMLVDTTISHLERMSDLPVAVFHKLFPEEEEREEIIPFMEQIRNNVADVTRHILDLAEQ